MFLTSFFMALEEISSSANLGPKRRHEILDRHIGFSVRRVEGKFLSGRFAGGENAVVLRRTPFDYRDQLHVPSHSGCQDNRQLETTDTGAFSLCAQGAAEDHALVETARLRRYARLLLQSHLWTWRKTRAGLVSTSAELQKRRRRLEFIPSRTAGNACCV